MLNPLSLIPAPYKWGALALALAATHGIAYYKGSQSTQRSWNAEKAAQVLKLDKLKDQSVAVSMEIDKKQVEAATKTKTIYKTIVKEVVVYVPKIANDMCVLTEGFVAIHDAAAKSVVPEPRNETTDTPIATSISDVGVVVAENYGTYYEIAERLHYLQQWVLKQQALSNAQ